MTGRLLEAARRAWAWFDCGPRAISRPPPGATMRDRWGRTWALWQDGRWIPWLGLSSQTRMDLLQWLEAVDPEPAPERPLTLLTDAECICNVPPQISPGCPAHGTRAW